MKKVICCILSLALVFSFAIPVSASLQYTYIDSLYSSLRFDELWGIAHCSGTVESSDDYDMEVQVSLQQFNGSYWETLKTWIGSGQYYVYADGSYAVARGADIRLYTVAYVYDTDGTIIEVASQIYD